MIVRVHPTPRGKLIALCDSGLLGKVFEEGDVRLDLSSRFYAGEEMGREEVFLILGDCYLVNAVGGESVEVLISKGLVDEKNVLEIEGIPYAQCVIDG